jgi:ribonuclease HIII
LNENSKKQSKNKSHCFTLKLSGDQAEKLSDICEMRGFEHYSVPYAYYAFRGNGLNLVLYDSGKLVIQGREAADFVAFTVEPYVTQEFVFGNEEISHPERFTPHAGLDESGKGDFFGPVVTACVIAGDSEMRALHKMGVRDSKSVSGDRAIFAMEKNIRGVAGIVIESMALTMEKYNALYGRFGRNLNRLLGWMHACSLGSALRRRYVSEGLLDQFSKQPIVQGFLKREFPEFALAMRTKAESDPVVAAASIIARAEFLRQMEALSKEAAVILPRGAGPRVITIGREIFTKTGAEGLAKYCKVHFKTFNEIAGESGGEV